MKEKKSTLEEGLYSYAYQAENSPISVLLIEDDEADARFVREMVADISDARFVIEHAKCLSAGLKFISEGKFDVILLDLGLPESDGSETLDAIVQHAPSTPVVVFTGLDDESLGVMAVQTGAQDYLVKNKINGDLLVRCLLYSIERHRLQKRTELMREEFFAMLTHDLKSSLSAIIGCASLIKSSAFGEISGKNSELIEHIYDASDNMRAMIEDIIESYKLETGLPDPIFEDILLNDLINEICSNFKLQVLYQEISLNVAIPDGTCIHADRQMIRRVFYNLISNAFRFTPKRGTISIKASPTATQVEIEVSDNGRGIPLAEQGKIFDKFVKAKGTRYGSGLGLYLVKIFLQAHGSEISLDSDAGKGTRFSFKLKKGGTME